MCGINGLISFSDSKKFINLMNEAIKHRGPDAEGEWFSRNVTLAHRRLSIIDLSSLANQPFIKDGLVIVYNGEIYNFLKLRDKLLKKGIKFRTRSDTEVVLELFRVYGVESFNMLLGMFSFCIYNTEKQELFLVRDYFGIKPLYYTVIRDKKLAFSSELKALTVLPEIRREINPKAIVSCINYLWIYGNESIFKGVKKVPPAHYMYIHIHNERLDIKIKRYWELKIQNLPNSENQLKERLKELLEESIRGHLIADVPVGGLLSGGLDSSLIAVIAKRFNSNLSTYTISISEKDKKVERMPDDNVYAKKVSKIFNINHKDIPIKPDAIKFLRQMAYILDEPVGDPAAINTYLICKAAKDRGIKVLLSGMGADEIFGGYRRQYATLLAQDLNKMPLFVKNTIKGMLNFFPVRIGRCGMKRVRWGRRLFSFVDMPIDLAYMRSYSYYSREELYKLFNYELNDVVDSIYQEHKEIFYKIKEFDDINKMCYADINMFMPGLNLTYTDRASMAASVEVRTPFIDKNLIEFAMSIDGRFKISRNISKYILRKAASDYIPQEIAYRPKASFGMPIRAWISRDLKELIDDVLSDDNIKKRGLLNPRFVRRIIDDDRKGREDNAYRIYQFLTMELWMRRYIDR